MTDTLVYPGARQKSVAINPATIYIVFRASGKCQIKAQLAANGYSIGKSCNAELALS